MKTTDALQLKPDSKILHKRYGESKVIEVTTSLGEWFGVIIRPLTKEGLQLLEYDSETNIEDFLEGSVRQIQYINRP